MQIKADEISKIIRDHIGDYAATVDVAEVGTVMSVGDGIARLHGVGARDGGRDAGVSERVVRHRAEPRRRRVGAVLLGHSTDLKEGDTVKRTGRIISVPVGDELVGRVVNALGQPIDGKGPIASRNFRPSNVSRRASSIVRRSRSRCRPD